MDAWTRAVEDPDGKKAKIVDEDIDNKVEESEMHRERAQKTEDPTQDFVTLSEVQDMIAAQMELSASPLYLSCIGRGSRGQSDRCSTSWISCHQRGSIDYLV